jgi:dTDP-4-dehydrorhamnose 3,5-epimerase
VRFEPLAVEGAFLVFAEPQVDLRGTFTTLFAADLFETRGLAAAWRQEALSTNPRRGTLRGLHWQAGPGDGPKLVRCIRGAVFDVVVDLRRGSATRLRWASATLRPDPPCSLYVPAGCAHGYQTLEPDSDVHYLLGALHAPQSARGIRWDDPSFDIAWPLPDPLLSDRDRGWPGYPAEGGTP